MLQQQYKQQQLHQLINTCGLNKDTSKQKTQISNKLKFLLEIAKRKSNMNNKNKKRKIHNKNIKLQNKMPKVVAPMSEESSDEIDMMTTITEATTKAPTKPPPIMVETNADNFGLLTQGINKVAPKATMKLTKDKTTVYPNNKEEGEIISRFLSDNQFHYFTFTNKAEKEKKFVIKGLPNMDTNEIMENLHSQGITTLKVIKMKTKQGVQTMYPFYFMAVSAETNGATINKIKSINSYIVRIEKYNNNRQITQCYNCQQFGHGSSNCHLHPKCLKCAGEHKTSDCIKTSETAAKCINCEGDHPANYSKCPKYLKRLENMNNLQKINKSMNLSTETHNKKNNNIIKQHTLQKQQTLQGQQAPASSIQQRLLQQHHQQTQHHQMAKGTNHVATYAETLSGKSKSYQLINELNNEISILNSLIDIKKMLTLVKNLNNKLKNNTDKMSQFEAFLEFTQELND